MTAPGTGPTVIKPRRRDRAHRRAAQGFDAADFFHREVRERLCERLQWVQLQPSRLLDLGTGTGQAIAPLQTRFPDAEIIAVDHAAPVLAAGRRAGRLARPVCADAARLPLADGSVGLVFCSLMLAYCPDPTPVLAEVRRVMAYPGLFSFATLGRDSLRELAAAWREADDHAHVAPFIDMHDLGDLLVHAGFVEPVLDTESITVTYGSLDQLIGDLRAVGSVNLSARRNTGLTGRGAAQRLRQSWHSAEDATGRAGITLEIIFGQAWAGEPRRPGSGSGEIEIPLAGIRRRGGATDTV